MHCQYTVAGFQLIVWDSPWHNSPSPSKPGALWAAQSGMDFADGNAVPLLSVPSSFPNTDKSLLLTPDSSYSSLTVWVLRSLWMLSYLKFIHRKGGRILAFPCM